MDNKVAIVTGGTGGIGAGICEALEGRGYTVLAADIDVAADQDEQPIEKHPRIIRKAMDVTRMDDIRACVATAVKLGVLTSIVNCAGILKLNPFDQFDEADAKLMCDINLLSMPRMTEAALPHLKAGAAIVNISSVSQSVGSFHDCSLYAAYKAAVEAYTRTLACELAPRGIRVNAISPGFITVANMSDKFTDLVKNPDSPYHRVPLGTPGTPWDIGEAAAFLLSEKARYITGASIAVDGGLAAA